MKFASISAAAGFFLILICLTQIPTARADFFQKSPWTEQTSYTEKIAHKLGFGFMNTFTGWTSFLYEPANDSNIITGLGKGIFYSISNTAGGMIHAVTFPIPLDVPLPHGGVAYEYEPR